MGWGDRAQAQRHGASYHPSSRGLGRGAGAGSGSGERRDPSESEKARRSPRVMGVMPLPLLGWLVAI